MKIINSRFQPYLTVVNEINVTAHLWLEIWPCSLIACKAQLIQGCHGQGKVREFCCKTGNFVICYQSKGKVRELCGHYRCIFSSFGNWYLNEDKILNYVLIQISCAKWFFSKTSFVFMFSIMFGTRYRQFWWCWKRCLVLTYFQDHYVEASIDEQYDFDVVLNIL